MDLVEAGLSWKRVLHVPIGVITGVMPASPFSQGPTPDYGGLRSAIKDATAGISMALKPPLRDPVLSAGCTFGTTAHRRSLESPASTSHTRGCSLQLNHRTASLPQLGLGGPCHPSPLIPPAAISCSTTDWTPSGLASSSINIPATSAVAHQDNGGAFL